MAFISAGLVGVGETSVIKHALDRQGGQSVLANREMMNLVNDMDDGNAWAVGRFDALISQAKLPEGVVSKIPGGAVVRSQRTHQRRGSREHPR